MLECAARKYWSSQGGFDLELNSRVIIVDEIQCIPVATGFTVIVYCVSYYLQPRHREAMVRELIHAVTP